MRMLRARFPLLIAFACFSLAAVLTPPEAAAQDTSWQLIRADYGFRNQRTDVTKLLRDLISRGGVNGRIAVNNQTMGGDPAVGKDKSLRVFAKGAGNQEREFDYVEGGFIPAAVFAPQNADRGDPDGRDHSADRNQSTDRDHSADGARFRDNNDDHSNRDNRRDLGIVRGFYGVQGRTVDVTDLLAHMVRNGSLTVTVSNRSMGGDPAIGADKLLIVVYKTQGKEQAAAVPEGATLSLP